MNTDTRSHRLPAGVPAMHSRLAVPGLLLVCALVLHGCASKDATRSGLLEPYRSGLPQGNYLTREQVDQVRPGMNRDQVRFLLGTPLLDHIFHDGRWDYVFSYRHPNGRTELRRVVVMFASDRVSEVVADPIPLREDASDPALPGQSRRSAARTGPQR